MPFAAPKADVYDACIIGSGAAGGMAAKVLTEAGLRVVLLEAGPSINPEVDFKQHMWVYELPRRGLLKGGDGDDLFPPHTGFTIPGEPYTRHRRKPFNWFRARGLGGRTNHWGQGVARFESHDFLGRSLDGYGEDWPITYEDLAPYYDKVEDLIGVFGTGRMPPPKPRCTEVFVEEACRKIGIPCVPCAAAILTRTHDGRPACHYCGQCYRGCKSNSCFSSAQVLIPPALATGRLTLITNAMARELSVSGEARIGSVSFIDKASRSERQVHARAIVLAAGACESTRLLLNSRSRLFPHGLANSSGVVGRYLRDSVVSRGTAFFPQLAQIPPHNHDGTGRPHVWIPWWKQGKKNDFVRGYHILFIGGRNVPLVGTISLEPELHEGYGIALKRQCRDVYGCRIGFIAAGEMISNDESYCEINNDVMDCWGIPTLRFQFALGDNEFKMIEDMQRSFRAIVEAGGGRYMRDPDEESRNPGGEGFQEQGTVRMGSDPKTSALNGFCQSHELKNLFVMDASCFVSSSDKPATLTILALAWRASEYLLSQAKRGHL